MAGDGVSGAHRLQKGLGLILLRGGCGLLIVVGRFLTLKDAQVGRRWGEQVRGCYKGPAREWRGSRIDREDGPGFT